MCEESGSWFRLNPGWPGLLCRLDGNVKLLAFPVADAGAAGMSCGVLAFLERMIFQVSGILCK